VPFDPPDWQPVGETRIVHRFVKHDSADHPDFASNFLPDADNPNKQGVDENEHPDHRLGMSVFDTEQQCRAVWAGIVKKLQDGASKKNKRRNRTPKVKLGEYIAEIELTSGVGFEIAGPPDERGHMTLRGPQDKLAAATIRVYPARKEGT
jgi:hypothetical protein